MSGYCGDRNCDVFSPHTHPKMEPIRVRNPHFHKLLDELKIIHDKKSQDYANDNVFSNFEFAAEVAKCSVDQAFLVLIGVKIARLHELVLSEKKPNNESVMDTFYDLTNYCAILTSYHMKHSWPNGPNVNDKQDPLLD